MDISVHKIVFKLLKLKKTMFLRVGNNFPLPVHGQPKWEIISLCPITSINLNILVICPDYTFEFIFRDKCAQNYLLRSEVECQCANKGSNNF